VCAFDFPQIGLCVLVLFPNAMSITDMMSRSRSGAHKSSGQKYSQDGPVKDFTNNLDDATIIMKNEKLATWEQINNKSKALGDEVASLKDLCAKLQEWMKTLWRTQTTSSKSQAIGHQEPLPGPATQPQEKLPPQLLAGPTVEKHGLGDLMVEFTCIVKVSSHARRSERSADIRIWRYISSFAARSLAP
jgi:hypothetical protein